MGNEPLGGDFPRQSWPLSLQSTLCGFLALAILVYVCDRLQLFEPEIPKGIQWIGRRKQPFSYLRAKIRTGFHLNDVLREGSPYLKEGRPVAFGHLIGPPQVILPPNMLHWMITQPESVISVDSQANGIHEFVGTGLAGDNTAPEILRRKMARDLDDKIPLLNEEICITLDDIWGKSEEWRPVDLKSNLRMLNARVANRILVGLPVCRDEKYLKSIMGYTTMHANASSFYHVLHRRLASLVSIVVKFYTERYISATAEAILPVLKQRVSHAMSASEGDDKAGLPLPNDFLTWLVERFARRGEDLSNLERTIAPHLLVVNIAAIEVTTFALDHAVRDLVRSDKEKHLNPVIEEAVAVLRRCNFSPEKKDLADMTRIERALKETLRRGVQVGFMRQISAPQGVDLEDGTHLPQGTRVCISTLGIHFDDDIYANAKEYNPNREEFEPRGPVKASGSDVTSMNRPTETYLSFGLGRRACPGRFVVSHQLKLTVSHILAKYEFKVEKDEKKKDVFYIRRRPAVEK